MATTTKQLDYFIASRLRNIPLVSDDRNWLKQSNNSSHLQINTSTTTTTTTTTISENNTTTTMAPTSTTGSAVDQQVVIGKRDASSSSFVQSHGQRIQSQSEVLFQKTGSTATIAKVTRKPIIKTTTTTTTRRPKTTTTTTRKPPSRPTVRQKPATTSSTTTRRPTKMLKQDKNNSKLAKMILGQRQEEALRARNVPTTTTTTTTTVPTTTSEVAITKLMIEPISSHKMSTLEAASSGESSRLSAAATTTTTPMPTSSSNPSVVVASNGETREKSSLTRTMQTLTTQPVNQRRTQQPTVQSRPYSSSRSGFSAANELQRANYGGENWYLFNRSDGYLSVFELLVLMCNVMIVSTVILVILFNWIKVFKKKRQRAGPANNSNNTAIKSTGPSPVSESPLPLPGHQVNKQLDATSAAGDRASKISLISSGLSSQFTSTTAGGGPNLDTLTTATTSNESTGLARQKQPPQPTSGAGAPVKPAMGERMNAGGSGVAISNAVESIYNNVTSAGAQVANKAMAIVQPSENTKQLLSDDKLRLFKDELTKQAVQLSRSVSDLSASTMAAHSPIAAAEQMLNKSADDLTLVTTPERVSALEQLFSGKGKDSGTGTGAGTGTGTGTGAGTGTGTGKLPAIMTTKRASLESIELPEKLVESIKSGRNRVDETLAPSPNMLLGQVDLSADDATSGAGAAPPPASATNSPTPPAERAERNQVINNRKRPENPMSRQMSGEENKGGGLKKSKAQVQVTNTNADAKVKQVKTDGDGDVAMPPKQSGIPSGKNMVATSEHEQSQPPGKSAEVKNHQVVVNKLDKRKTQLEIVDLRDESVRGKLGDGTSGGAKSPASELNQTSSWISMDGVAVVQPAAGSQIAQQQQQQQQQQQSPGANQVPVPMSPSEIIESRFNVDYKSNRRKLAENRKQGEGGKASGSGSNHNNESMDSKQEEYVFNNIENELEQDNRLRNRKYFVYIVHDGHFTAKKECIARIELPQKRRITLAELRQLIASSQDISLSSLRRNRFKFVTETYRLLNENEDAAILHQVYPTQGVFLKLNVAEGEHSNQVYPFKGGQRMPVGGSGHSSRLSSTSGPSGGGGGGALTSGGGATIASRRRANARSSNRKLNSTSGQDGGLPAIDVSDYGRTRSTLNASRRPGAPPGGAYRRSKSNVQMGARGTSGGRQASGMKRGQSNTNLSAGGGGGEDGDATTLPALGMSQRRSYERQYSVNRAPRELPATPTQNNNNNNNSTLTSAASDLGANMLSGAKKLFNSLKS